MKLRDWRGTQFGWVLPLVIALLVGGLTVLPDYTDEFVRHWWNYPVMVLWFATVPGMIASVALAGNVHDFSLWSAAAFNFVLYGGASFLLLRRRRLRAH